VAVRHWANPMLAVVKRKQTVGVTLVNR
jgi:hypothetical protein